jgi:hypothetical protein
MSRRLSALAAAAAIALSIAGGPAGELAPTHGPYAPRIHPANFVVRIDNRYLSYEPGASFHFEGVLGTTPQTDDQLVLRRTTRILGVRCTVVRDTVSEHGRAIERTDDYYAQDRHGNVWYMGEDSFELQHGRFVKASDSWKGGVDGAQPGIIMPAHPRPGDAYRQEFFPGHALDRARVARLDGRLRVPFGAFDRLLVTNERSPLDRGQVERKWYAAGVGEIAERVVKGPHEEFMLVSVSH